MEQPLTRPLMIRPVTCSLANLIHITTIRIKASSKIPEVRWVSLISAPFWAQSCLRQSEANGLRWFTLNRTRSYCNNQPSGLPKIRANDE
jgi:hypothetical protein